MDWLRISGTAYWCVFVVSFLGVAGWESLRPRRLLSEAVERRWGRHGGLLAASMVLLVLVPVSPVLLAATVSGSPYGALNRPWLPYIVRLLLALLLLDLVRYLAHRAMHSFQLLWRVHQVHHSDRDFDVSTSVRAHPLEVLFFRATTLAAVAVLAPPLAAVIAADLLSAFESFFSHANASLPDGVQRFLGRFLYTADSHRVHHSVEYWMQNRNFGDIFPWWDQLFGTYEPPPSTREDRIVVGLEESPGGAVPGFGGLLRQPFLGRQSSIMNR